VHHWNKRETRFERKKKFPFGLGVQRLMMKKGKKTTKKNEKEMGKNT